jgi:hypothetical protein
MKNFLIIVLSLGLATAAFLTRPDRGEFERYVRERTGAPDSKNPVDGILKEVAVHGVLDNVEFKDFYLWTVVRKDGKTLYTGVFDRWIDNQKLKDTLPS